MSLKSRTDYKLDLMAYGQTQKMKLLRGEIATPHHENPFDPTSS